MTLTTTTSASTYAVTADAYAARMLGVLEQNNEIMQVMFPAHPDED